MIDGVSPVNVAEDSNSESLELFGKILNWDGAMDGFEAVGLEEGFSEESSEDGSGSPF